tara:strand:+ start:243 stop:551 length:309 start_codon:yes stop_codon:yes gene_type:complete
MKKKFKIFYTTIGNKKDAKVFSKKLLKNPEIICINIFANVLSMYRDKKNLSEENETVLVIKTFLSEKETKQIVFNNHPYDIPFLSRINCNLLSDEYYKWAIK